MVQLEYFCIISTKFGAIWFRGEKVVLLPWGASRLAEGDVRLLGQMVGGTRTRGCHQVRRWWRR
jgi:hypothetical protein